MRILLDHNVPVPLRHTLRDYRVETTFESGCAELSNGALILAAERSGFDLLITTDKGIVHQLNWSGPRLFLLVLSTNDWARIRGARELVIAAVQGLTSSKITELEIP